MTVIIRPQRTIMQKSSAIRVRCSKRGLLLLTAVLLAAATAHAGKDAESLSGLTGNAILDYLNTAIDWYRQSLSHAPTAALPSDAMYQFNAQTLAAEATQLAFQAAQATATLITSAAPTQGHATDEATSRTTLAKMESDVDARIGTLDAEISTLNQQIAKAHKSQLQSLTEQRDTAQGELDLRQAMQTALQQMTRFNSSNGEAGNGSLQDSISELKRGVPELTNENAGKTVAKPASAPAASPAAAGLIGEVVSLYDTLQAIHGINQLLQQTAGMRQAAMKLRSPLLGTLRATVSQGELLASQSTLAQVQPGPQTPGNPNVQRQQFDALAARFKQIASATLPLSQQIILLDQSTSNLQNWRQSVTHESNRMLRSILARVFGIAVAIGILLLLSEIWRRITFRYVSDPRRRRQFLVLRRVVMGFCMGIVLILGFVSEFSSLATFAGFITAGLAVGLQTILLSVAAYFFLVGRWGIRVGDRISVAGVTGDVVDVGLVRLYLMELAGTGVDLYPSGRIVVFSNSVLFQATTPLFKQLPGSEFGWHEVVVTLNPTGKYALVESEVMQAVQSVHAAYSEELQRQLGTTERRIDVQLNPPEPHGQLQYSDTALEYVVRYPVGLRQVSETDEKVTRKLLEMLAAQPELQSSIAGLPRIRAAVKG